MNDKDGKIVDRREMLKVKVKSLAAEAQIIRKEERKARGALRDELHNHRVLVVRCESRRANLAYGFIRGRTLEQMERTSTDKPDWKRIRELCTRYGPPGFTLVEPQELKIAA